MQQLQPAPTLISRGDVYKLGRARFFTGRECKYGHVSERYVSCGACILCLRKTAKSYARGKLGADVDVTVRVHPDDAGAIRDVAAMLAATRDAKSVATFDADRARAALFPALKNAPADYAPAVPTPRKP